MDKIWCDVVAELLEKVQQGYKVLINDKALEFSWLVNDTVRKSISIADSKLYEALKVEFVDDVLWQGLDNYIQEINVKYLTIQEIASLKLYKTKSKGSM